MEQAAVISQKHVVYVEQINRFKLGAVTDNGLVIAVPLPGIDPKEPIFLLNTKIVSFTHNSGEMLGIRMAEHQAPVQLAGTGLPLEFSFVVHPFGLSAPVDVKSSQSPIDMKFLINYAALNNTTFTGQELPADHPRAKDWLIISDKYRELVHNKEDMLKILMEASDKEAEALVVKVERDAAPAQRFLAHRTLDALVQKYRARMLKESRANQPVISFEVRPIGYTGATWADAFKTRIAWSKTDAESAALLQISMFSFKLEFVVTYSKVQPLTAKYLPDITKRFPTQSEKMIKLAAAIESGTIPIAGHGHAHSAMMKDDDVVDEDAYASSSSED